MGGRCQVAGPTGYARCAQQSSSAVALEARMLEDAMLVRSFVVRQAKAGRGVVLCGMGCSRCIGCMGASAQDSVHILFLVLLTGHGLCRSVVKLTLVAAMVVFFELFIVA